MTTKITFPNLSASVLLALILSLAAVLPVADAMAGVHSYNPRAVTRLQPTPVRINVRMFQASQTLEIQYDSDRDITARVVITNIIGKTAQVTTLELQTGENINKIDVANLPQGTYIVQVISGNWASEARKFVKANP
jgi:hypothetical protein